MSSRLSFRWPDLSPGGYGGTIEAWELVCRCGSARPYFLCEISRPPAKESWIAADDADPEAD